MSSSFLKHVAGRAKLYEQLQKYSGAARKVDAEWRDMVSNGTALHRDATHPFEWQRVEGRGDIRQGDIQLLNPLN